MHIRILIGSRLPKAGLSFEECEDQLAIQGDGAVAVVSDGASEAIFSKLWARCLVERYHEVPTVNISGNWLLPAIERFMQAVDLRQLPWHAVEKLRRGSFATLAALVIDLAQASFNIVCVGDSLVAWHGASGSGCFPTDNPDELRKNPYLIGNRPDLNVELNEHQTSVTDCRLTLGTTYFFLMTDALAEWYLLERQAGRQPWNDLLQVADPEKFQEWVKDHRQAGRIRNDDVALIGLVVEGEEQVSDDGASIPV